MPPQITDTTDAAASAPRSAPALVTDRTFGPYFWGSLVSNSGTWFQTITAAVVVFQLTRSVTMVGLVSVLQFGVSLVLAPWAGSVADRVDRRRLLIATQILSVCAATAIAVWVGAVGVEGLPGPWPILGASLLIGIGFAFSVPAMQALVPAFVGARDLDGAIALNSATFNLARAVGPALAGLTLAAFGPGVAFGVNAASYLPLIVALTLIRPRDVPRAATGGRGVREGFRVVRRDGVLAMLLLATAAVGIAADPVNTLTPALVARLEGDESLVGLAVTTFGLGAGLTAFFVGRLRRRIGPRTLAVGGLIGLSAGIAGVGITVGLLDVAWAMLVSLFVAGAGYLIAITVVTTLIQQRTDEHVRGRVMALWSVAFLGSRPLSALVAGTVADTVGAPIAAVLVALLPLAIAVVVGRSPRLLQAGAVELRAS